MEYGNHHMDQKPTPFVWRLLPMTLLILLLAAYAFSGPAVLGWIGRGLLPGWLRWLYIPLHYVERWRFP